MTEWFRIKSGEHAGRPHLAGWMESAIHAVDGYVGIATCPLCRALVGTGGSYGDQRWAHEQWHARTDFPIPEDL